MPRPVGGAGVGERPRARPGEHRRGQRHHVIRRVARSSRPRSPAAAGARRPARLPAQHQQDPQRGRPGRGGQGERDQHQPAEDVPGQEPVPDRGDRLRAGPRAGLRIEHGRGGRVALHRSHDQLRAQRPDHPQPLHVQLGVADLHQPRRPGHGQVRRAGADRDVLAERDDLLPRCQRHRHRQATPRQNSMSSSVGHGRAGHGGRWSALGLPPSGVRRVQHAVDGGCPGSTRSPCRVGPLLSAHAVAGRSPRWAFAPRTGSSPDRELTARPTSPVTRSGALPAGRCLAAALGAGRPAGSQTRPLAPTVWAPRTRPIVRSRAYAADGVSRPVRPSRSQARLVRRSAARAAASTTDSGAPSARLASSRSRAARLACVLHAASASASSFGSSAASCSQRATTGSVSALQHQRADDHRERETRRTARAGTASPPASARQRQRGGQRDHAAHAGPADDGRYRRRRRRVPRAGPAGPAGPGRSPGTSRRTGSR